MNLLKINIAVLVCAFLVACGEDSTTEKVSEIVKTSNGVEVVADISGLPKCEKSNEKETVWVRNEMTPRMCSDGKWYAVAENSVTATCYSEVLGDGSGMKIVCGGDSIGVVYNGQDGAAGIQGEKGDTGPAGDNGVQGDAGLNGRDGKDGVDGKDGADGTPGTDGKDGRNGVDGAPGADGRDGADGKDGTPGADGRNGENGRDGNSGVGCSMDVIDEISVLVVCGEDSVVLYIGTAPDTTTSPEVQLDSEKIAISLDEVSGVSQKGPFLNGSSVLVREMEDGRTLTQTGNSFNGKILNDKGEFKINARMLVSQYVMLEANGYYRNEVTGENSNSALTLFAITDVNDRNIVNVNLLTHLEYERVIYLVTKKKMKVRAAKKQAQKEVFALLDIDATNFSNSEDLNLAGSSDEDGALLAFSAVLQGDRSVAELSELLTTIATDMEKDGEWNDAETRLAIARWAALADSAGRLGMIRDNVKRWGISSMVPNFEKYIRHFWTTEYGLDSCNANRLGDFVSAKPDAHPDTRSRFICKEDSAEFRWYFASGFEKDTWLWKDTTDGALKKGNETDLVYVFDSTGCYGNVGWRLAKEFERPKGGCRKAVFGEYVNVESRNGELYQCREASHRWELVKTNPFIDSTEWSENDDGYSRGNEYSCYVYDTSAAYNGWRQTEYGYYDCGLGIFGCTIGRRGEIRLANDGRYYRCDSSEYAYEGIYWQKVDRALANTQGWNCLDSNDGEIKLGLINDAYFICEDGAWRETSAEDERNCRENGVCHVLNCTEKKRGRFEELDGVLYVCDERNDEWKWREPNCAEEKTRKICDWYSYDSPVVWNCESVGNFEIDYVCTGDEWHVAKRFWDYTIADWKKKMSFYYTNEVSPDAVYGEDLVDGRNGKVYKTVFIEGKRWMAQDLQYGVGDTSDYDVGFTYFATVAFNIDSKWGGHELPTELKHKPHQGICPNGWHLPDTTEWKNLVDAVGVAALQMKGFVGWKNATDASGFSAIPYIVSDDDASASFWSGDFSFGVKLNADELNVVEPTYGIVRCVEDDLVDP